MHPPPPLDLPVLTHTFSVSIIAMKTHPQPTRHPLSFGLSAPELFQNAYLISSFIHGASSGSPLFSATVLNVWNVPNHHRTGIHHDGNTKDPLCPGEGILMCYWV